MVRELVAERIETLRTASYIVFTRGRYRRLAVGSFLAATLTYAILLPAAYTGGRIGLVSLQQLTPLLAAFAVTMGALLALVVAFTAFGLRSGAPTSGGTATTGILGGVVPPLLCCSPLLPTIAAAFAGVIPGAIGVGGVVQGVLATYLLEILTVATLVLVYSVLKNARGVTQCAA